MPSAKDRMWLNRSIRGQFCNLQGHKPCVEVPGGESFQNQGGAAFGFFLQELFQGVDALLLDPKSLASGQVEADAEHVLKFDGIFPDWP